MAVRRENGSNTDRPRTDQNFSRQGRGSSSGGNSRYAGQAPQTIRGARAQMVNTPSESNENTDND